MDALFDALKLAVVIPVAMAALLGFVMVAGVAVDVAGRALGIWP